MPSLIKTELSDGIFTITINRPDKMNALNRQVLQELDAAIQEAYDKKEVKGVIITGAGEKAFVAGADISEILEIEPQDGEKFAKRGQDIFLKIENCPKPVIAAVNGFALGGGCELAMSCHFRLASDNAKFGQPEVNLGIIPGYGGTQRLPVLVGKGKAMELMMTGAIIDAKEAKSLGLVNYVTPLSDLLTETNKILTVILSKSPIAVSKLIQAVNAAADPQRNGFDEETTLFGEAFTSDDKIEGTKAFLEKRKPNFTRN